MSPLSKHFSKKVKKIINKNKDWKNIFPPIYNDKNKCKAKTKQQKKTHSKEKVVKK